MSWSSFTASLDRSRSITKAERDELWDAFIERVGAAGLSSYTISANLKTSGALSDLVPNSSGVLTRLLVAIRDISTRYVRTGLHSGTATIAASTTDLYYSTSATDSKNVLVEAAAVYGLSYANVSALMADPTLESYHRWNIARKAIQLLACPKVTVAGSANYADKSGSDASWATASSNFISGSESTGSSFAGIAARIVASYSGGDYGIVGERWDLSLTIPSTAPFTAGYTLEGWRTTDCDPTAPVLQLTFDGATIDLSAPDSGTDKVRAVVSSGTRTTTGSLTFGKKWKAYGSSGDLAAFEPAAVDGSSKTAIGALGFLFARPTFTHP